MTRTRDLVTLANLITSASVVSAFLGLVAAARGDVVEATTFVVFAAVFDFLDGAAARRGPDDYGFGSNLDSLADVVAFGVVPAMALYVGPLHDLPVLGVAGSVSFLLAGAWRLARFPLVRRADHFVGLPIPVAGVVVMLVLLWRPGAALALLVSAAASALMVSTLPFPTFPGARRGASAVLVGAERRRLARRRD